MCVHQVNGQNYYTRQRGRVLLLGFSYRFLKARRTSIIGVPTITVQLVLRRYRKKKVDVPHTMFVNERISVHRTFQTVKDAATETIAYD